MWRGNVSRISTLSKFFDKLDHNILSAIQSNTLLEFTYRDDSSANRNYYVDITNAQGLEETAYDERGTTQLLLTEP